MTNELLMTNGQEGSNPMKQPAMEEQRMGTEQPHAEREGQTEVARVAVEVNNLYWKGAQSLAAVYINAAERFGSQALELHNQASQWGNSTPWASLLKSQQELIRRWLDGSAHIARTWWQLELAQTEAEKVGSTTA